ncbi:MAG TPA: hypothetical protein VFQ85_02555 [Mycobacteriales bacterium]|jgi:hypothetical protein|nr:hypothetical protein [Mycobacteriales bacterium]
MSALDRWCALAARAYPSPERRAEVLATLLDANDGRRRPRPGDLFDVVRHGLAARLRAWPASEPAARWADAAAVAAVGALTILAAIAAGTALRLASVTLRHGLPQYGPRTIAGAAVAAAAGVALLAAVYAGRVRLARRLAVLGAVAGGGAVAVAFVTDAWRPPAPSFAAVLVLAASGLLALLLGTDVVARSARVMPARAWWRVAALALAVAVGIGEQAASVTWPYNPRHTEIALVTYAAVSGLLLLLSLPLWAFAPKVVAGAALLATPAAPVGLLVVSTEWRVTGRGTGATPLLAAGVALATLVLARTALRAGRTGPPGPASPASLL